MNIHLLSMSRPEDIKPTVETQTLFKLFVKTFAESIFTKKP